MRSSDHSHTLTQITHSLRSLTSLTHSDHSLPHSDHSLPHSDHSFTSLTDSLTHSLTQITSSLPHSLTQINSSLPQITPSLRSLTQIPHSLTHSLTHSDHSDHSFTQITHSPTHSLTKFHTNSGQQSDPQHNKQSAILKDSQFLTYHTLPLTRLAEPRRTAQNPHNLKPRTITITNKICAQCEVCKPHSTMWTGG